MAARWLVLLSILGMASGARAAVIVDGTSLLDLDSGLRWGLVRMPTATFIPDVPGLDIADLADYYTLVEHMTPVTSGWSPETAAAVDWLETTAGWLYGAAGFEEGALCHGPYGGGNCFAGSGIAYYQASPDEWQLLGVTTASLYGPTFTRPPGGTWDVDAVYAYTVEPIPLPGAAALFVGGLALFSAIRRKRAPSR